ncbi:MAG TPA: hypothetical protein VFZ78_00285 [Flavisolibacter sp.]
MENENKKVSRVKFLSWGVGIASLLAIPAFLRPSRKKKDTKTVKMLTQDGRLVTIDVAHIPEKKKKIDEKEIHMWVQKNKGL